MNRYEKGKIYKIVDIGYNKCYIGSTTEPLSKRMERHRKLHKRYLETGKVDTRCRLIFEEFGVENCKIELLENYPCMTKEELLRKEGEYIQNTDCVNRYVAGRTPQEYRHHYQERYKQQQKERYENNKEKIKQQVKENQQKHKEEIRERQQQHYQEHKEEITAKRSKPYHCVCGSTIWTSMKARHFKTKKHQDWLNQQDETLE